MILDESESIISQINGKCTTKAFTKFEWLLKHADKLLVMDATMSTTTYSLIQTTRYTYNNIKLEINTNKPETDQAPIDIKYQSDADWLKAFRRGLPKCIDPMLPKRIFVATNSKKHAKLL